MTAHDSGDDPIRAVYNASCARLVTQVVALCGNRSEAEDVVQDAFFAAMTHREDLLEVANGEAWLRTTSVNLLRNRWRRARVLGRLVPRLRRDVDLDLGAEAPEDHIAVVDALSRLSLPLSETVVLHYIADLTVAQVAHEFGIPEGTVKARLSRARASMAGYQSDREGADHA